MNVSVKAPLHTRIKNSSKGVFFILKKPLYLLFALIMSFLISGFIVWSLNLDLVRYIIVDAPLTILEKLHFFWAVHTGIYSAYNSTQATGILLFGILFGINASLILYVIKNGGLTHVPKKSGGFGLFAAMLSGGCVACGTSILAPLLATLGATSSVFILELSNILNWISILLMLFSIYTLGGVISNIKAKKST